MLGNFKYSNPTTLYFGDKAQSHLAEALRTFGKKVMLIYGGGSIKRNGVYDDVMAALKEADKEVVELSGVMPNPTVEKMEEGAQLARRHDVDFILAVGGGSTIDYAKAVSVATWYDGDAWQHFWVEQANPAPDARIIPLGAVLTMAGTGSEMNGGSVITNHAANLKIGKVFGTEVMPKFAVLNPRYTFSLPHRQLVAGIYDMMNHIMEQYFSGHDDSTSDYLAEGLMRSIVASSLVAVKDPENYEARSNLMWSATWALNTLISQGKREDWMVHMLGHAIGAYTDATHGMTLSAVSEAYYRYVMQFCPAKFARFAEVVWDIPAEGKSDEQLATEGIDALMDWIRTIGAATRISQIGATPEMIEGIADATIILDSGYKKLTRAEVVDILRNSL